MTGGDRMLHHGYGHTYARYLAPFLGQSSLTLAEFGILKGTGLAIWCDLFPSARVIGFDIDLSHFTENRAALEQRGAFQCNSPEIHEFDQLAPDLPRLMADLRGAKLDIVIDDGLHSVEAIVANWRAVKPLLSPRCVYFIEDNDGLLGVSAEEFNGFDTHTYGLLTVVSQGLVVDLDR
jgi:SAM-dependent methyltransferase